ncbi:hypothetical protein [Niabella aurantiaca]|uniref:hypothetical protein n=1 Tax=Niabella aurantiaca TaxID=379900 RepID=UPI0003762A3B|nr:hypothetical protein [Niabella aurantiaca]
MSDKPVKAKPHFYACCLLPMQEIAKDLGYNLIVHGSLNRDMDLVAIPWVDDPKPEAELIQALDRWLRGVSYTDESVERGYLFSVLPGGRHGYVINLNRGGRYNQYTDEQWYLDISITPLPTKQIFINSCDPFMPGQEKIY